MPGSPEAGQLLGVQVEEHTGILYLEAHEQRLGLQDEKAVPSFVLQYPPHRALGKVQLEGDVVVEPALPAEPNNLFPDLLRGAPEASPRP